ncbi:MAG: T9SS type A sorting domain-containing protein [Bacteroidetes bacterium]|nr:T9SS type A sorting domain-containing protein [Bacteroidota bacterium]
MRSILVFIGLFLCTPLLNAQTSQNGYIYYPGTTNATNAQLSRKNCLLIDSLGNKWVGYQRAGLGKFSNGSWSMFNMLNSALPDSFVTCLAVYKSTKICIGTRNGFALFDGVSNWNIYTTTNSGIIGNYISCITVIDDDIWIGTRSGISKFSNNSFTNFTQTGNGLLSDTVLSIAASPVAFKIWIGTQRGLTKLENGIATNYNALNSNLPTDQIVSLLYHANKLWIGTVSNSLYLFNGISFYKFNNISNSAIETNNRIYFIEPLGNNSVLVPSLNSILEVTENTVVNTYLNYYANLNSNPLFAHYLKFDANSNLLWIIKSTTFGADFTGIFSFDRNGYESIYPWIYNNIPLTYKPENLISNNNAKYLDANNVKALILNRGDMFYNPTTSNSSYEVPKGSGKTTMGLQAFWISGLDAGNNLHLAAQTYRQIGTDYYPGPLDTLNGSIDSATSVLFDKVWKISARDIEEFKFNFSKGLVQNASYLPTNDIITWPASGMGNYSRKLAPFVDVNSNGVYDPLIGGDYPQILGDQMTYTIFNDNLAAHGESGGTPLKMEVHASAYSYNCGNLPDSLTVINNTTFYKYEIFNRSTDDYHDVKIGILADEDLGNASDDAIGSDSSNNFSYCYNIDLIDPVYGSTPPIQSQIILNGPPAALNDGIDNNNDGQVDELNENCLLSGLTYFLNNSTQQGNPLTTNQFANYLNLKWRDNTNLTYGGTGYGGTQNTRFAFPGRPTVAGSWYCSSANDYRTIARIGAFELKKGESVTIDFADIFSQDTLLPYNSTAYFDLAKADAAKIKNWFSVQNYQPCTPSIETISTLPFSASEYCAGDTTSVRFVSLGNFNPGNVYTVELSDGEFGLSLPFTLGNIVSNANSGTIQITFPASLINGKEYWIRVNSSNPPIVGAVSTANLILNPLPPTPLAISGTSFVSACQNQLGISYSISPVNTASAYAWTLPNLATIAGVSDSNVVSINYSAYSSSGNIKVSAVSSCGVKGHPSELFVNFKPVPLAEICSATVDSLTQKTIISWQRATESYVNSYVVFREVAGAFTAIDTVPNVPPASYLDTASHPELKSEKYKIAVLDSCGNVGDTSAIFEHRTMYLYGYVGAGSIAKLYWTDYIGNPDPNRYYNVMRDSTGTGNFTIIATNLPKTTLSYTDASSGAFANCRYYIDMFSDINCDPNLRTLATKSTSRSNIKNKSLLTDSITFFTGVPVFPKPEPAFKIYPNPAKDLVSIVLKDASLKYGVSIYDMLGREVLKADSSFYKNAEVVQLPLNGLTRGLYFVRIKTAEKEYVSKLNVD